MLEELKIGGGEASVKKSEGGMDSGYPWVEPTFSVAGCAMTRGFGLVLSLLLRFSSPPRIGVYE